VARLEQQSKVNLCDSEQDGKDRCHRRSGQRFFEFRRQLDDKARLYGASVVVVVADRWFPSGKTCSCCGSVTAKLDLSQRVFRCGPCGLVADRDCNACEKS
jgi:transposase